MWTPKKSIEILLVIIVLFTIGITKGYPMESYQINERQEAFIQLKGTTITEVERAIEVIESVSGRVLHTYPPSAIVAAIPPGKIGEILSNPEIESVDTDEISDERLNNTNHEIRLAVLAWNEHIRAKHRTPSQNNSSEGLLWDDPNRLPPDPPPHIQQFLRQQQP
jgi:hypothetical protein